MDPRHRLPPLADHNQPRVISGEPPEFNLSAPKAVQIIKLCRSLAAIEHPEPKSRYFKPLPSLKRLRQVRICYPASGELLHKVNGVRVFAGENASVPTDRGYSQTWIDGQFYPTHRVMHKMFHGCEPKGVVHPIDGNRGNNRISNLADVSPHQNSRERHTCHSSTNVIGVYLISKYRLYAAEVFLEGKTIRLGRFTDIACAIEARLLAERHLYGFDRGAIGRASK